MKERIRDDVITRSLEVYPFLEDNATPQQMACEGCVEAFRHFDRGSNVITDEWRVRVNMTMREGLSRDESDKLLAAINRCWEWVGEQEKSHA